ncbi:MAG: hypothetical protein ICV77_18030, partial [Cyanobacteria bacterium Co-bin8]|nr:hypothetical protein [Cyanobacteria bacterium Co-bin8]
ITLPVAEAHEQASAALEQPITSTLEDKIGGLIDVMQQLIALQVGQQQSVGASQNGATPAAPRSTPATPKTSPKTTQESEKPHARSRRGESEQLINAAIDAIMAYNDAADRYDDKWAISINVLKSFTKAQKKIEQALTDRADEIQAHHQKHQIDIKHNYKHRGESVLEFVKISETAS